jgi:uncharacterized protein YecE (DUF72 family)
MPAVEINSSFYRAHKATTYARWAASVPAEFRFSVKLPKQISHDLRLIDPSIPLNQFFSEVAALGTALGCVLVQLPPSLTFDETIAETFFATMREGFDGDVALEPRHATWAHDNATPLLRYFRIARVAADPLLFAGGDTPAGDRTISYFRLHGSPRTYYSAYTSDALLATAARVRDASRTSERVWCIFDNTTLGAATSNALDLLAMLR